MTGEKSGLLFRKSALDAADQLLPLFPILNALPTSTVDVLHEKLVERRLVDGETLFMKGQPESFIALIVSGRIHTMLFGPSGRQLVIESLGPGQLIGETALINFGPRTTSACSAGKTRLWVLPRHNFPLLNSDPAFMYRVSQLLCERLRHSSHLLESVTLYRLESRLARFLLAKVDEVGPAAHNGVEIPIPANQGHLAAMINVSRPKLNAQLQQWLRSGVICWQQDRLRILDIDQLKACANH